MSALRALGRYLERCGYQFDRSVNTLLGGNPDQTLSLRAAIGAGYRADGRVGRRFWGWCVFCRFLSRAVQPDHCALQFSPAPSPAVTYIRAGLAFGLGGFLIWAGMHELWRLL